MTKLNWGSIQSEPSKSYVCGYCGQSIASEKGWYAMLPNNQVGGRIYVCHQCSRPTYFDAQQTQTPGIVFGNSVSDIDEASVSALYEEARKATGAGSYTSSVLACRKLLMHIAVDRGATPGETFISYVEYLAAKGYVPPDARGWVDLIRAKGNEANHEIRIMSSSEAQDLLSFCEMLLKLIYEFPAAVKRRTNPGANSAA